MLPSDMDFECGFFVHREVLKLLSTDCSEKKGHKDRLNYEPLIAAPLRGSNEFELKWHHLESDVSKQFQKIPTMNEYLLLGSVTHPTIIRNKRQVHFNIVTSEFEHTHCSFCTDLNFKKRNSKDSAACHSSSCTKTTSCVQKENGNTLPTSPPTSPRQGVCPCRSKQ